MEEKKPIFRKNALEKISSPDQITDYIRVVSPSVWLIFLAIAALLIAVICWSAFGLVESKIEATFFVDYDSMGYLYIPDDKVQYLREGMDVRAAGNTYQIYMITDESQTCQEFISDNYGEGYVIEGFDVPPETLLRMVLVPTDLHAGEYKATIVVEQLHPLSFITD